MTGGIGIVGAGISAVQLALRLQQLGIGATVYSEQTIEQMQTARPRHFPARFGRTREREEVLGLRGAFPDHEARHWRVTMYGEQTLGFLANLRPSSSMVDFRIYLPALLSTFADRGGTVEFGPVQVDRIAPRHDLVVVANGWRSMGELFPRDPARSPYTQPQRLLSCGLYHGVTGDGHLPHTTQVHFLPGRGEIFVLPWMSRGGLVSMIAFEAIPGGPLAPIRDFDAEADPAGYARAVMDLLAVHTPSLRDSIDATQFELIGPGEFIQGALTPVVRRGWAELPGGHALAIGDAWITNDPLAGQGANLGSRTAFALADLLAIGPPFDAAFCRQASEVLWSYAEGVTAWSNAFLAPPPPHVIELFLGAARDQAVADGFVGRFNDPLDMWRLLSDPAATREFVAAPGRLPVPQP